MSTMMSRVLVSTGRSDRSANHTPTSSVKVPPSRVCAVADTGACLFRDSGGAAGDRRCRMADRSLKAKQRDQKQRTAAKEESNAAAKAKQASHMRVPPPVAKTPAKARG